MDAAELQQFLESVTDDQRFATAFLAAVPRSKRRACLTKLIGAGAEPVELPIGAELFAPERDDERLWLVLSGGLDEWRGQIRVAVRRPGDLVGELPALQPGQQTQGLSATTRAVTRLLPIRADAFSATVDTNAGFARAVLRALAWHAADYADDESQFHEALDQWFPRGRGQLVPGPFIIRNATVHYVLCYDADAAVDEITEALPPGTYPLLRAPLFLVVVADMGTISQPYVPNRRGFHYDEVSIMAPVWVRGHLIPRLHVPYIFPDNIMAIYLGREVAGLPKLRASTFHDQLEGGVTRLLMRRLGRTELEIRYRPIPYGELPASNWCGILPRGAEGFTSLLTDPAARRDAGARLAEVALIEAVRRFAPKVPFDPPYFRVLTSAWKRILSPGASYRGQRRWGWRDFQVDALTQTPFSVDRVHELTLFELVDGGVRTHPEFPAGRCRSLSAFGVRVRLDMTMAPGKVLKSYPWPGLAQPG